MKIKEGFMLRELAGSYVVVPTGEASVDFNGMITLNETGAFLFKMLIEADCTEQELLSAMLAEYEVEEETALKDIGNFVAKIKEAELFA